MFTDYQLLFILRMKSLVPAECSNKLQELACFYGECIIVG